MSLPGNFTAGEETRYPMKRRPRSSHSRSGQFDEEKNFLPEYKIKILVFKNLFFDNVIFQTLRRTDHSSRGTVPTVMPRCV
jgi:hypothetical protein